MNFRDNGSLRERLAAEYILGTLRGGARRRFEGWLQRDAALRGTVEQWRGRLMPMAEFATPATPPPSAWAGIAQRLRLAPQQQPPMLSDPGGLPGWLSRLGGLADSLAFWRGLAVVSGAAAAILAVTVALRLPAGPAPAIDRIAMLADDKAQAALIVTADSARGAMVVSLLSDTPVPADKTLQLWAITRQGKPRSLGILPGAVAKGSRAALALSQAAVGADVALLAVSLEPKGGSPDPNGPTGPVLYKGAWVNAL